MNPEAGNLEANEADILEQQRDIRGDEGVTEPPSTLDTEADPADVTEQNRALPPEDEEWSE